MAINGNKQNFIILQDRYISKDELGNIDFSKYFVLDINGMIMADKKDNRNYIIMVNENNLPIYLFEKRLNKYFEDCGDILDFYDDSLTKFKKIINIKIEINIVSATKVQISKELNFDGVCLKEFNHDASNCFLHLLLIGKLNISPEDIEKFINGRINNELDFKMKKYIDISYNLSKMIDVMKIDYEQEDEE